MNNSIYHEMFIVTDGISEFELFLFASLEIVH